MTKLTELDLAAWSQGLPHAQGFAPSLEVARRWVTQCAPVVASLGQQQLAVLELGLFLFYPDDSGGDDADDANVVLDLYERFLSGELGLEGTPLFPIDALRRAATQFKTAGLWSTTHIRGRRDLIAELKRRNAWRDSEQKPTFAQYLEIRKTTIYIRQWVELWSTLLQFMPVRESQMEIWYDALEAAVEFEIFQNEVVSLERDVRTETPNLVVLLAEENSVGLKEAATLMWSKRSAARQQFERAARAIREAEASPTSGLHERLDVLNIVVSQTARHYDNEENIERYARWSDLEL